MSQLGLFESGSRVLIDDHRGLVRYTPDCVSATRAGEYFDQLRAQIDWRAQRRMMYDREVDVPRLTAQMPLDARTPEPLRAMAMLVSAHTGTAFNSIGLNFYRDGRDSVAPHNDKLNDLVVGAPIALLSLGATRRMQIRAKETPRRRLEIDLESGSILLMNYAVQVHYDHGIPKERTQVGPRISLAFRVRPSSAD